MMFRPPLTYEKTFEQQFREDKDLAFIARTKALVEFAEFVINLHQDSLASGIHPWDRIQEYISKTFIVKTQTVIEVKK